VFVQLVGPIRDWAPSSARRYVDATRVADYTHAGVPAAPLVAGAGATAIYEVTGVHAAAAAPGKRPALATEWPSMAASAAISANPPSRGHLVPNSLADRVIKRAPKPTPLPDLPWVDDVISGATFVMQNVVPVWQPYDGQVWAQLEKAVGKLVDVCWGAQPNSRFFYMAGPSREAWGYIGNSAEAQAVGAAGGPVSATNLVKWPKFVWALVAADLDTTAKRTVTLAWRCSNSRQITVGNEAETYTGHLCEYMSVNTLAGLIGFDPLPTIAATNAVRANADPLMLLPQVGDIDPVSAAPITVGGAGWGAHACNPANPTAANILFALKSTGGTHSITA